MRQIPGVNLQRRVAANDERGTSRPRASSRFGLRIRRWVRGWQQPGHVSVRPQRRGSRTGAVLLAAAAALVVAVTVYAETADSLGTEFSIFDPPVATLVTNMLQPSGSDRIVKLNGSSNGFFQGFRTGPHQGGYELTSILLYVRDTHESRYMTINGGLYRDAPGAPVWVAPLTRGQLDDFAHNEWQAPANTYLDPNTNYYFALDCTAGCANDNYAQLGTTYSDGEDSGGENGWTIQNHLGFRKTGIDFWFTDHNQNLRIRIKGRPSPYRAYKTEIVSTPVNGNIYRYGENIDVVLTFNTEVYMPLEDPSIGIRVGNAAEGSTHRAAGFLSGSGTDRLVYRYQVQVADVDANGISVDEGGQGTGYSGSPPTTVGSLGMVPVDRHYPGLADAGHHKVDGSLHVTGVEITSSPAHGDGYRFGEEIEVTLTFTAEAFVGSDGSVITIRVGDATDDSNYRAAEYASGSGTKRLVYRYRVQFTDFDATGISVDEGGAHSGFGGQLPTANADLGPHPTSRDYPGIADDASHKVDRSVTAAFDAGNFTISEDGTATTVTVELDPDPGREITIPISAAPGDGATIDDYTLSTTSLDFAPGETVKSFTVTATDDSEDDDGESVTIAFGSLPSGVRAGGQASASVSIADNDGATTGQTVTIRAGREACIATLDDVIFNLTLAEAMDQAIEVNVRLAQEQPFLDSGDLTQRVEFPANANAAELRISAD